MVTMLTMNIKLLLYISLNKSMRSHSKGCEQMYKTQETHLITKIEVQDKELNINLTIHVQDNN